MSSKTTKKWAIFFFHPAKRQKMPLKIFQKTRKKKGEDPRQCHGFCAVGSLFIIIIKSIFVIGGNIDNIW
jgi:hypothetical protein